MIPAKEIARREKAKNESKKEMYRVMLEQFCRKIKTSYELRHKETILSVPPFIIGFPKYDLARAVVYMTRQLQKLGYQVDMVGPLSLKVRWFKLKETEVDTFETPMDILPGLANLQKTAQQLRKGRT